MAWCQAGCLEGVPDRDCGKSACLIRAARDGEREARERLFARLLPLVRQQARRLCGGQARQEDIVQTALLQALAHLSELRRPERFAAWVRRIVTNAFLMEERNRQHEPGGSGDMRETLARSRACEEEMDARRELARILRLAPSLPPVLAETFRLRVVEGLSTREAAERLGVSEEAVRARLSRARKRLREPPG
ncbi:MAG: sigma-70 family RNA polymerase sigma factor [Bryobacteraceae bacterium]|nr:sigma-70 family RNA polymerase sigma factor [Bryobacteraceae bacterium]